MGFWAKLFGTEVDTTVADHQARVAATVRPGGPFSLTVEDVFSITGRGTVVTGVIQSGTVGVDDVVRWSGPDGTPRSAAVRAIEQFRAQVTTASAGELVGLLLADTARTDLDRGTVLTRA